MHQIHYVQCELFSDGCTIFLVNTTDILLAATCALFRALTGSFPALLYRLSSPVQRPVCQFSQAHCCSGSACGLCIGFLLCQPPLDLAVRPKSRKRKCTKGKFENTEFSGKIEKKKTDGTSEISGPGMFFVGLTSPSPLLSFNFLWAHLRSCLDSQSFHKSIIYINFLLFISLHKTRLAIYSIFSP